MPAWSSRSAEPQADIDAAELYRRFVEASRRAEIVALVNSSRTQAELGAVVSDELCEAFEAEVAFLVIAGEGGPPELVGHTGVSGEDAARVPAGPRVRAALETPAAVAESGENLLGIGLHAAAFAPIITGRQSGVLGVGRMQGAFDEAELALLEAVSASVGEALARMRLEVEHARHATQQAAIARAARRMNGTLQLGAVLEALCEETAAAFDADAVTVLFADGDEVEVVATHGSSQSVVGTRRRLGTNLSDRAIATGEPQTTTAYEREVDPQRGVPMAHRIRIAVSVPLRRRGKVDGAISIGYRAERRLGPSEIELLEAFADLAGVALANAHEHEAARAAAAIDTLTGCLNHGAFQTRLREELSRAERGGEPFTLVILDLDDFKGVNERHGHLAGDAVLRTVGEVLRGRVRMHDRVARFGGDEFALLLPATPEHLAAGVVERAVKALEAAPLPQDIQLRAQAGLAEWQPGETAAQLVERADDLLRSAKHSRTSVPQRDAPGADTPDRARRRAEDRVHRLARAVAIGAKLARLRDPVSIAQTAAGELHVTLGIPSCAVLHLEDGELVEWGSHGYAAGAVRRPADEGAVGRALQERRTVLVADLERDPAYAGTGVIGVGSELAVPVYAGADLWGAIDLCSPEPGAFDPGEAELVGTIADHVGAALRAAELNEELERTYLGTAEALAAALEAKDGATADHARSIADLAVAVAHELGITTDDDLRDIRYGAIFHDIGKIAIPDAILLKPGRLTDEEFEIVKRHPIVGEQILAPVPFLSGVRRIVRHDHERWDGAGYPDGLRGEEIPLGARIVLVVDAWHAMVSDRPYRQGMNKQDARNELITNAGTQFDPHVVDAMLRVLDRRAT